MTNVPDIEAVRAALAGVSAIGGFNRWLAVETLRVETGNVEIAVPVRPEILQHHGFVHGGVLGAIADTVVAWTGATMVGDVVTSGYSLQFLAPAVGERVVAVGEAIKAGRTSVSVQARVYTEAAGRERKLVAVALASVSRAPSRAG